MAIRAKLISNIDSGSSAGFDLGKAVKLLHSLDVNVDVSTCDTLEETLAIAKQSVDEDYDRMIVVGGDGTISQVAQVLANTDIKLGILPTGTANLLSHHLNIPSNFVEACKLAASDQVKRVDLGVCNGKYFLLMAGIGFDAEIVGDVTREVKRRLGPWAYVIHGLRRALNREVRNIKVSWPGGRLKLRSSFMVIGNAKPFGDKNIQITPDAEMDDGMLDICVFEEGTFWQFWAHLIKVLLRRHTQDQLVVYFKTPSLRLETVPKAPIQLDGDLFGETPAEFFVVPKALNLIAP